MTRVEAMVREHPVDEAYVLARLDAVRKAKLLCSRLLKITAEDQWDQSHGLPYATGGIFRSAFA